jgi:hypothetical protein
MPLDLAALGPLMFAIAGAAPVVGTGADTLRRMDDRFLSAAAERDASALDGLLDAEFTWTDSDGQMHPRADVLRSCPRPADQDGAEVATRLYGEVGVVTSKRENVHAMRIFARRDNAWRALVYHEVTYTPGAAGAHVSPAEVDTSNPCLSIPYTPRSAAERDLIESWKELERAVVAGKGDDWAPHVADEFVVVGNQRIQTKAERRAAVNKGGAAPPPLISARLFDFGDTMVMTAVHQPHGPRKPTRCSRVFIKGDPVWQMAISYQTTIKAEAPGSRG